MKKALKSLLCLLLALSAVMFPACNRGEGDVTTPNTTGPRGQRIDYLTLNGRSIAEYKIITSTGSLQKKASKLLSDAVLHFTGISLVTETEVPQDGTPAIYIGKGEVKYNSLGAYFANDKGIYIDGSYSGLEQAVKYFIHSLFHLEENQNPSGASYSFSVYDKTEVSEEAISMLAKRTIYVSPNGNDSFEGTKEMPLVTIEGAIEKAKLLRSYSPADVVFDIHNDCYYLANLPLTGSKFNSELSGEEQDRLNGLMPGIICWGDSLTQGVGASWPPFTETLEKLIQNNINPKAEVINRGVGGESSATIVGRSGAIPFVLTAEAEIPAEKTSVGVHFALKGGGFVTPLMQGASEVEVTLAGVKGTLTRNAAGYYAFTRLNAGEAVVAAKGSELIFSYSEENLNCIPVIFMGENGGWSSPEELVSQAAAIRDKYSIARGENGKYIVIGIASGSENQRASLERAMEREFGDRFINLREFMSTTAPYEAKLTPTKFDIDKMEAGYTPPCMLLSDGVHFTKAGFELVGKLVYQRMGELGFFG